MAFKAHVLSIKIGAGAATLIGGMVKNSAEHQSKVSADVVAGSFYPLFASIQEIKDRFMFTTYALKDAIDLVGFAGLSIDNAGAAGSAVELFEILYDNQGQIKSGSVHRKIQIQNGRIIMRRLSCQHRNDAQLDLEVLAISSNGVLPAVNIIEGVASPGAATDPTRWTLGDMQVESINLGCVQDFNIDFGFTIDSEGCGSNTYDTQINVKSIVPTATITTKKTDIFTESSGIPQAGLAITNGNTFFKLRKRVKNTGSFVAAATAEHILIRGSGIATVDTPFSAQGMDDATATVKVTGVHDGTNTPFTINTASAI